MTAGEETCAVHGTAVAFAERAVLILGASGAGKSGLALRLMALGARLVSDDRVVLERRGTLLVARPPEALAGMIEARGVGLIRAPHVPEAVVVLAVDLDQEPTARMPQMAQITYLGCEVELISGQAVPNIDMALMFIVQNGRVVQG